MFEIKDTLFLAPLAGYTDYPFRQICRNQGARVTVSEMISVKGLLHDQPRTFLMARGRGDDHPYGIQLFGYDPDDFGQAAALLAEKHPPDFIDVNSGCPVRKVIKQKSGVWLMQDPERIGQIVSRIRENCSIPVSVKIRLGWDTGRRNYIEIGNLCQEAGAAFLTVHARTRVELFSGEVDYEAVKELVENLSIPVVGNGNIADSLSLQKMKDTGCAACMIGRAAVGRPWIFKTILEPALEPSPEEKIGILNKHLQLMIDEYGEKNGFLKFRSHGVKYIRFLTHKKEFLRDLFKVNDPAEFRIYMGRIKNFLGLS